MEKISFSLPVNLGRVFKPEGFLISLVLMILTATQLAQAPPGQALWQQFSFCKTDGSLFNNVLTVKNMEDRSRENCSFNFTTTPLFYNCSLSGSLLFAKNGSCIEMLTEDLETKTWGIEYGNHPNGHSLIATPGEMQNETTVMNKISAYCHPPDTTAEPRQKDNPHILKIIAGVLVPVVVLVSAIFLLYRFCEDFKRWVRLLVSSLVGSGTINATETGTNPNANSTPLIQPSAN
ncbi:uncharacterized protein LOC142661646 [Rhinoderma darwinii]|uniref:uncharacterized protein LOC142661646 n=1 Tax=Rhinoderma darwinii TaxID=43563 RepID=UPI003F66A5A1